jgi:hypothetical protein
MLLTMVRKSEFIQATWDEVDFGAAVSGLSTVAQVCVFGLFEDALADIRAVLTQAAAMRE